jgi:hypothetical protein
MNIGKEAGDRQTLLHILRNPSGWGEEAVRETRLKAAKELERLWRLESETLAATHQLNHIVGMKNG